ncbi:hypothetical protein V5O48_009390 [Marasmius crinis-equi]|uniref:Uncharacterized protein n=1 Tax=Marasmius crinis-equi TaxID=585013 RepID=A0ABR3FBS9_9AGAR
MVEKAASRPWTKAEDELLRAAVGVHGAHDNWKAVASQVPGRNNKACRKRWLHSLSPTIKKTPWTGDEDNRLLELMAIHGQKWSLIARQIPGRTDDACSKRYNEALDPNLRKGEWTSEEDERLLTTLAEIGQYSWKEIGQCLGRSGYKLLERKRKSSEIRAVDTAKETSQSAVSQSAVPPQQLAFDPPYYPPESYPLYQENPCFSYREPTPESQMIPVFSEVTPFQFSSSSLSAALTDPSPSSPSQPLLQPSNSVYPSSCNTPSAQLSPTLSSPGQTSGGDLIDDPNLLGNFSTSSHYIYHSQSMPSIYSEGDAIIPLDPATTTHGLVLDSAYSNLGFDTDKSPLHPHFEDIPSFYDRHAGSPFTDTSPETNAGEVSASCSPLDYASQLPPAGIADVIPEDISCLGSLPSESLLFSNAPSRREPTPPEPTPVAQKSAESSAARTPQRLSTVMPLCSESTAHFQQALSTTFCAIGNDDSQQCNNSEPATEQEGDDQSKRYVCDQPDCFKTYKNASGLRYHKKHGHPKKLPMQLNDMPPSLARDLPIRLRKMRKKDG